MEIVIPFKIDQSAAVHNQPLQCIKYGIILFERVRREPQPEVKQVSHDIEDIQFSLQLV